MKCRMESEDTDFRTFLVNKIEKIVHLDHLQTPADGKDIFCLFLQIISTGQTVRILGKNNTF